MKIGIDAVEARLRRLLVAVLHDQAEASRIESEAALIEEGFSLDSVALLDLVVRIENEFQIMLDDEVLTRKHFKSLTSLSEAVTQQIALQTEN